MSWRRIIVGTSLAIVPLLLWAATSVYLVAPRPVRAAFDLSTRLVGLGDLRTRCSDRMVDGNVHFIGFIGARACYRFLPTRRFRGIFIEQFEGQFFLEGVRPARQYRLTRPIVWLSIDEKSDLRRTQVLQHSDKGVSRIFQIEFVGRKTSEAGGYGHFGMSDAAILVERTQSARLLSTFEGYVPDTVLVQ